jgi:hypothetical protein
VSEFEGLNLPQLMELMHDLARPEPVTWFPQTVGWWVVLGWLLALGLLAASHAYLRWKRNRYRREALRLLDIIEASGDATTAGSEIATTLKRAALVAYPRRDIASLHGAAWSDFLSTSSDNDATVESAATDLASAAYRPDVDGRLLIEAARRWIEVHRG